MSRFTRFGLAAFAAAALSPLAGCDLHTREVAYRTRGGAYFAQGKYEKARVELNNALQIDPKDAAARFMLGQTAERLEEYRMAAGHYQATIDLDPANNEARAALARLYLLTGAAGRALALVEEGLKNSPDDPHLLAVRGAVHLAKGDYAAAVKDAEDAAETAPDDEYVIALRCSLYRRESLDKAIATAAAGVKRLPKNVDVRAILIDLLTSAKRYDEAESELKDIIKLKPADVTVRFRLARFYAAEKKDPAAAERTLREAIVALPESNEAKLALVRLISAQHGLDAAVAELTRLLAAAPDNDVLRLGFGLFYQQAGRTADAERLYRAVMQHDGVRESGLTARTRIAGLRVASGDTDAAAQLVAEVLRHNPRDTEALLLDAQLALARDEAATAVTDLRAVLRDQPGNVPLMRALANAHEQNGDSVLAEEVLREALDINPRDIESRLQLAQLLSATRRLDEALAMAQQTAADAPNNSLVAERLFRLQLLNKDVAAAARTATALQVKFPRAALGYYLAGLAAEARGDSPAALSAYDHALQVQPQASDPLRAAVQLELAANRPSAAMVRVAAFLATNPKDPVAMDLQGQIFTVQKQTDAAARAYTTAMGYAPRWPLPYLHLALLQVDMGASPAAVETLKRGLAATRNASDLGVQLGIVYQRMGRPEDAIGAFNDVVTRDPRSLPAVANLVTLLASYRNDRESIDRARRLAMRLSSITEPDLLATRGWLAFKTGAYSEAVPLLEQAIEKLPESPLVRYRLGMALLKSGHAREARRNLEVALKAGKNFVGIEDARATLIQITPRPQPTKTAS